MTTKTFICFISILTILALGTVELYSAVNASLSGRVIDPAGAAVPDAEATLTRTMTGASLTTTTNPDGEYIFPRVEPGEYRLVVRKDGFQRLVRDGVIVQVNERAVADVQLEIGEVSTSITIEAAPEIVQTGSVDIGVVADGELTQKLPLNGKNFLRLSALAPGLGRPESSTQPNNFPAAGARSRMNSYVVDGVTSNDERIATGFVGVNSSATDIAGTDAPNIIPSESIQEFRMITTGADATFGRGSGLQATMVTKSGGNDFHGSLYEYLRNDKLEARDFFNTGPFLDDDGSATVPPFKQHVFGGAIGGPIRRNKHFFFFNYEALRQRRNDQSVGLSEVPNADLINLMPGDLGTFYRAFYIERGAVPESGNPPGLFAPLGQSEREAAIAAGFPSNLFDGNPANGEAGTVLVSAPPRIDINQHAFNGRVDLNLAPKWNLMTRYANTPSKNFRQLSPVATDIQVAKRRFQQGVFNLTYVPSATQILEIRGGLLRNKFESTNSDDGLLDPELERIGVPSDTGIRVQISGASLSTNSGSFFIDNQTTPHFSPIHTWRVGSWTVRSGADVRWLQLNLTNNFPTRPTWRFQGFVGPNGLLGASPGQSEAVALSASRGVFGLNGGPTTAGRGFRSQIHGYFSQADWRIRNDLTVNLGLRYEYFGPYSEVNDAISNLYAVDSSGNPVEDAHPFANGRVQNDVFPVTGDLRFHKRDLNNLQPRIGLAWNVGGGNNTVVRAGYGIYHDRINQIMFTAINVNPPFSAASTVRDVAFSLAPISPDELVGRSSLTLVSPDAVNPYTQRFSAAVEQRLNDVTSVTVAYVGARGRNLYVDMLPNGAGGVPQDLRPDPRFSQQRVVESIASSEYDSLQVNARRRFAGGLHFTAAYTYAFSNDNASTDIFSSTPGVVNLGASAEAGFQGGGDLFVPRPIDADWGSSRFDLRHNLTMSYLYELPMGRGRALDAPGWANAVFGDWSLSGIATLASGVPIQPLLGQDVNDDGTSSNDRPQLLSGSLDSLLARSSDRTEYLVTQQQANRVLGIPQDVTDPFLPIERNPIYGPALYNFDVSAIKEIPIREATSLRFEANFFNIFNHANLGSPEARLNNSRFGQISSTVTRPRQIQFGLKLLF